MYNPGDEKYCDYNINPHLKARVKQRLKLVWSDMDILKLRAKVKNNELFYCFTTTNPKKNQSIDIYRLQVSPKPPKTKEIWGYLVCDNKTDFLITVYTEKMFATFIRDILEY